MARALQVGENVWVPRSRVGQDPGNHPSPFARGRVIAVVGRSVDVDVVGTPAPARVASAHVQRDIGLLSVRIGDFGTEASLLDPLAKSVGQFCRLLLPDDYVRFLAVRSLPELLKAWAQNHAIASVVMIAGHGSESALIFGVGGAIAGEHLAEELEAASPEAGPKVFISLACLTGHAGFARPFSKWTKCSALLAPFHSVHGAVASQFAQTFLVYHLLEGETVRVAFNHARARVAGATSFRMWVDGALIRGI